ncbi:hypothetical protein V2J09_011390 [Rumex salicifolius]
MAGPPPPFMQPMPAPAPSFTPLQNPVVVVGPQYLAPYPADLVVTKKLMTLREGQFNVTDVQGNVMFSVKGSVFSIHDQRVVHDAGGVPILCLRQKVFSAHRRWYVYRGESSKEQDMLFTVKKSSIFQMRTRLDVFLAANSTKEEVPDFHIEGKFMESGCTISLGNTTTVVAQMHRNHSIQSLVFDKDTYAVTVYPNVDYAFIVALIVVLHEINADRNDLINTYTTIIWNE